MKTASLSALAMLLAATATPAAAGVVLDGGGKVTGITDLAVGTATYNVAFRSGTFTSVFGSAPDFTTSDAADLAIAQVNLALNPSSGPLRSWQ